MTTTHGSDHVILRELLAARGDWVSGTHLARKLGVSRVAVWAHMNRLRREGFKFEAIRSRGYRLLGRPSRLSQALLHALLRIKLPDGAITVLDEVDSTNSEAERRIAAGQPAPFAVFAAAQTNGRGRFGRVWHSPDAGNLYASFAFRPRVDPTRMQLFTLWMGVNLCEVLESFFKIAPAIKWPNDLLVTGRKVGGMLTEARIDADRIRDLIFGVGINVNADTANWPRDIARTATSLADVTGAHVDINQLAAAVAGRVFGAFNAFIAGGFEPRFGDLWARYDSLRGTAVGVNLAGQVTRGTASGIDGDGSLLVATESGRKVRFRAGEVTLEKGVRAGA
jgi:BirA family transcriptional regulator, biotin operon repressor / biotin---[acetyl-CoA-carboxylase] ligase